MFGWIKESAVYEAGLIGSSSWDEESSSYKVQLPAEVLPEAARVMDKGYLFYVHGTIEAEGTESEFYLRANKMEANRILFAEGSTLTEGLLTISYFDLTHVETEVADLMNDVTDLKTALPLITGNEVIKFTDGYYISTNQATTDVTVKTADSSWRVAVIDCVYGDKFTVTAKGASSANTWAFVAEDGTTLLRAKTNVKIENAILTAPVSSRYLVINDTLKTGTCYVGDVIVSRVNAIEPLIYGVAETIEKGNLYPDADIKSTGYYYYNNNGSLARGANANFSCFILPVIPDSMYSCKTSNVVLLDESKSPISQSGSYDFQSTTSFITKNAVFVAVSFRTVDIPETDYVITQGSRVDPGQSHDAFVLKNMQPLTIFSENNTTLLENATITIQGKSAIKDGLKVIFKGVLTVFDEIKLKFSGTNSVNYITVDSTTIEVKNSSGTPVTLSHGLTITNDIFLMVEFINEKLNITLASNGVIYKEENVSWYQTGGAVVEHQIISTGTICSSSSFKVVYDCAERKIWYFGDSYASFNNEARWAYYANNYGFLSNIAVSGSGGCSSGATMTAFITMLSSGTPDFAVFATGMNDGSDTSDSPSSTWKKTVELFIEYCNTLNIVPVLATIPTVPTVNNEKKNEYVRNSGYRFIDFAKAVGASSSGVWYSGMLSSDNVHPSVQGAKALFTQLLIDLPEITQ